MTCDHTENHPFIPYGQRHPMVPAIGILAGSLTVCGFVGLRFRRQ
jgi:hypothetical protein